MRQVVGHYLEHLRDDVGVGDVPAEGADLVGKADDAQREVIDALPVLEDDVVEVLQELLGVGVPDALNTDAHGLHRVPGGARGALTREGPEHLRWDGAEDGGQCEAVLAVLDDVALLRLDGVPEPLRLHVHAHEERPLLVVGAREHGVGGGAAAALPDALDDDLAAALASAAGSWRGRDMAPSWWRGWGTSACSRRS
jgi:hypothetical protein